VSARKGVLLHRVAGKITRGLLARVVRTWQVIPLLRGNFFIDLACVKSILHENIHDG